MCVLEAEGRGVPVLFCPALPPWQVPSTLWTPHLCKEVPFLNRFQAASLRGCELKMRGVPHPGAAFSRAGSLLPGEVSPGQSSLPPQSGRHAGFVGAVRPLVATLEHGSSRGRSPRPPSWVRCPSVGEAVFSPSGGDGWRWGCYSSWEALGCF